MLQLKHLNKSYRVGDNVTRALNDVSISFRDREFVAILGPSGSGKTTLLNVIGGLDRYDSGDLIINGRSTKNFKETDWDAYRNNTIGFIFQNYNLIGHLSIMQNVELGMNLSGMPAKQRRQRAEKALIDVGLKDQLHKNPNQLSGGQMQRVAIARAIANDPDILLCDEPTGALDTQTSLQIMEIIKKLSRKRLVIMVTHNPDLAQKYATRIVNFRDGKIQHDSAPCQKQEQTDRFHLKRTKMSYWNAIKLSFTNILTKKGQTILTAFAASIGIISIAVVLSLSNGFQKQINSTMSKALAKYPVAISQTATDMTANQNRRLENKIAKNRGYLTAEPDQNQEAAHTNHLTQKYVDYVKRINPAQANNISYQRGVSLNLLTKDKDHIKRVLFSNQNQNAAGSLANMRSEAMASMGIGSSVFPTTLNQHKGSFLKQNYSLLAGKWPRKKTDLVLVADNQNHVNLYSLKNLGLKVKDGTKLALNKLVGKKYRVITNDDYYQSLPTGMFIPKKVSRSMYQKAKIRLRIVGVIRPKTSNSLALLATGVAYSDKLSQRVVRQNKDSAIVKAQKKSKHNVMTGQSLNKDEKKQLLQTIGGSSLPTGIMIYPNNFVAKDKVLDYLDAWNKGKAKKDKIVYTDMSSAVTSMTGGLLNGITTVLVAFAAISLITSMIMIGILTYASVLERTKEIGVLKALGARKKDITRVFDAETFILGIFAGLLGVGIGYLLTFPLNHLLYHLTDLTNVAQLNPVHALILILISTVLTLLGGHIPARMAAKKDAAIALRSE